MTAAAIFVDLKYRNSALIGLDADSLLYSNFCYLYEENLISISDECASSECQFGYNFLTTRLVLQWLETCPARLQKDTR